MIYYLQHQQQKTFLWYFSTVFYHIFKDVASSFLSRSPKFFMKKKVPIIILLIYF